MIICTQQLTDPQLKDLDQLMQLCQMTDGGTPAIYRYILKQKRETKNSVLYYQQGKLIGLLSVYFFYENACEVSLLIAPDHRKKKIASELLEAILPLMQIKGIEKLIFSSSTTSCNKWLPTRGFVYQQSEYHMERNSFETRLIPNPLITLRKATSNDLEALFTLDKACFPEQPVNMLERFTYLLEHPDYNILLALNNNQIVGKAHIHWREENILLSDIAILPIFQGKGFGSELIANCINLILAHGKTHIALDVETTNKNALNLYARHGFKTTNSYEYWTIATNDIHTALQTRGRS